MGPDHGSGHSGRPAESPFQQDGGCSAESDFQPDGGCSAESDFQPEQQKKLRPLVEGFLG